MLSFGLAVYFYKAPSLFKTKRNFVYETVFVRIDRDLSVLTTVAQRSCTGTSETTSIAVANTRCQSESNADTRSIADAARSDVDADI